MALITQIPEWHTERYVQRAVRRFSQQQAVIPRQALQESKRYNDRYLTAIRTYLKAESITRGQFEYVGSAYENLKIKSHLEIDILIILKGAVNPISRARAGFYNLREPKNKKSTNPILQQFEGEDIQPFKVISEFFGYVKKALVPFEGGPHEIVVRLHGPAVQLDVYKQANRDELWYSVDLVPVFKSGKNLFVAKHSDTNPADIDAWRMSHTLEEKRKFVREYNQDSRRECLRVLKVCQA